MSIFNEQAQLFMAASMCMLIGMGCLYLALGVYVLFVNKLLQWTGVHAGLMSYLLANRKAWWSRMGSWMDRLLDQRMGR